ncbi:Trm112 family protein [Gammaproteobacteria bacterium]|nr:Trm112 family protein [Gammaproteobacteria bacterium]
MDKKLLGILACPICKGPLVHDKEAQELICYGDNLAFPIRDEIPIMLENEARTLSPEEKANRKS